MSKPRTKTSALVAASSLHNVALPTRRRGGLTMLHRHRSIAIGGFIVCLMIAIAVLAPYLGTVDPTALAPAQRTRFPTTQFWFGTDMSGRDLYSRVIYGTRVSLEIGFGVAFVSTAIGIVVGLCAGLTQLLDAFVMRVVDGMMAIPGVLLAIALMALTRPSVETVIIAIAVSETPRMIRLVRGIALSLREELYVKAAIAVGSPPWTIMFRHILPNAMGPISVQATFVCASAMLGEAILSFIGAGTPPTIPSWGNIMAEGRTLWQVRPYIIFFPAIFLSATVLAINLLGDGLRDALDPKGNIEERDQRPGGAVNANRLDD